MKIAVIALLLTTIALSQDSVYVSKSGKFHQPNCTTLKKRTPLVSIDSAWKVSKPCKLCLVDLTIKSMHHNDEYVTIIFIDGTAKTYKLYTLNGQKFIILSNKTILITPK